MNQLATDPLEMLRRPARIIGAMGVIDLALLIYYTARTSLYGAGWPASYRGYYIASVFTGAIYPILYAFFARRIALGRYAALLASGVLSAAALMSQLARSVNFLRFSSVYQAIFLAHVLLQIIVLTTALMARPAMASLADGLAVIRARGRLVIALSLSGFVWLLIGLAGMGVTGFALFEMNSSRSVDVQEYLALGVVFAIVMFCFAVMLYSLRAAIRTRRGVRPTKLMLAMAIVELLAAITLLDSTIGGGLYLFYRYTLASQLLTTAIRFLFIWQVIDLIHARRICEEPATFGFEPVFAKPVIPVGGDDAAAT